jgi:hypothetical protein
MNNGVNERKTNESKLSDKKRYDIAKALRYTLLTIGAMILLGLLCQILEYLFVGAILFIAWFGPGKWW